VLCFNSLIGMEVDMCIFKDFSFLVWLALLFPLIIATIKVYRLKALKRYLLYLMIELLIWLVTSVVFLYVTGSLACPEFIESQTQVINSVVIVPSWVNFMDSFSAPFFYCWNYIFFTQSVLFLFSLHYLRTKLIFLYFNSLIFASACLAWIRVCMSGFVY
jgi:hypothetical protein